MPVLCMRRHVLLSLNLFCPLSRARQHSPPFGARRVIMPYFGGLKGWYSEFVVQLRTGESVAIHEEDCLGSRFLRSWRCLFRWWGLSFDWCASISSSGLKCSESTLKLIIRVGSKSPSRDQGASWITIHKYHPFSKLSREPDKQWVGWQIGPPRSEGNGTHGWFP